MKIVLVLLFAALAFAQRPAGNIAASGSGGGSSSAFSAITSGMNTSATMVIGSGASLSTSGTGTNNANQISSVPVSVGNSIPTVVSTSSNVGGAGTSIVVTAPASISNGNALFAMVTVGGRTTETWTPPAGFTQVGSTVSNSGGTNYVMGLFCKVAASESGNYTFSFSNSISAIGTAMIMNISGTSCTSDGFGSANANASSLTISGIATTLPNDLIIVAAANVFGGGSATIDATNIKGIYTQNVATSGAALGTFANASGTTTGVTARAFTGTSANADSFVGALVALPSTVAPSSGVIPISNGAPVSLGNTQATSSLTSGYSQAKAFVIGNGVSTSSCDNSYAVQLADGKCTALIGMQNANNVQIDPSGASTFVTIGSGLHTGPGLLASSGSISWVSQDISQDLLITSVDSSNNLYFGNANSSGSNEQNDQYYDVQTGKTHHVRVNATDVMTITGSAVTTLQPVSLANGSTGTTQSANDKSTKVATTAYVDAPVPLTAGTSCTFSGKSYICVCTSTCTITVPVPSSSGATQYCVANDVGVSTVITLSALGSSAQYGKTDQSAYGTASTGTMVSGGALGDQLCIYSRSSTKYNVASYNGTWTNN